MVEQIKSFLSNIKNDNRVLEYDEATAKQTIILRIFNLTGWNIFSIDEVAPEYSIEDGKVDYALRTANKAAIFVEVKKPQEDLDKHQEQLLNYAFRQGINLAVLTNGITWWFYLPMKEGNWSSRKFYTIDIFEQDIDSILSKFIELLSKDAISSGEALRNAENLHKSKMRRNAIAEALPEAWNRLIVEPDSLLVDLLAETAERICGHKPEEHDVIKLLRDNQDRLLLDAIDDYLAHKIKSERRPQKQDGYSPPHKVVVETKKHPGRGTGRVAVYLDEMLFEAGSIPQLYERVLRYVVDKNLISKLTLPWGIGTKTKRYFVFHGDNPVHLSGKSFENSVTYGKYHLEAHVARIQGVKYLGEFCKALGFNFKIDEV